MKGEYNETFHLCFFSSEDQSGSLIDNLKPFPTWFKIRQCTVFDFEVDPTV
jgi:hypothetical protein